jgi:hypothetical protein
MKDVKLPNGRLISEWEVSRQPENCWSMFDDNISTAAEIVESEERDAPTAEWDQASLESYNRYRGGLKAWLDGFTAKSWMEKDSPMEGLRWIEKLALFHALLSVTGDCGTEIVEGEREEPESGQAAGA